MSATGVETRIPPGPATVVAAGSTAVDIGVDLTYVTVCAAGGALTMRFGDSAVGAAATTDWPLAEGEKESFYVTGACRYVSIQGVGALKVVVG